MYQPRLLACVHCLGQLVWEEGTETGIWQVRESLGTSAVQGRVGLWSVYGGWGGGNPGGFLEELGSCWKE